MRHSRCIGTILLGSVVISVALATKTSDVKKPYGPKMCERRCNRIAGCSSYIYRMSDLSCHVTPAILQNKENGIYLIKDTKDQERMHAENALNCSEGEQIFRTRGYIIKCRPILPNTPTLTNKDDGTGGRILMMPYRHGRSLPGRQLYLVNSSIVTKYINALAYIPSQRKLAMSTDLPRFLILASVDAKEKTVIKTKHEIVGIVIDDEKQLMFIHFFNSSHHVGVMKTQDKSLTLLLWSPCSMGGIGKMLADSKRSLIYVLCSFSEILQLTYQGFPKGRLVEMENVGCYILHIQGDILYHQTESNTLVQISLSDYSVAKLPIKMPFEMRMLLKIDDLLYMLPAEYKGDILVVNMSDMGTVTKLKIGFGMDVLDITMCLIP